MTKLLVSEMGALVTRQRLHTFAPSGSAVFGVKESLGADMERLLALSDAAVPVDQDEFSCVCGLLLLCFKCTGTREGRWGEVGGLWASETRE